jgi:hypothetical protein
MSVKTVFDLVTETGKGGDLESRVPQGPTLIWFK